MMHEAGENGRGLARENPAVILALGLIPAAAVSGRVIDALWMSVGVFFVLVLSSLCIALIARGRGRADAGAPAMAPAGRWLGALLISSCLAASFEVLLLAFVPEASGNLGIYAPLIAVNCLVLTRIDAASREGSVARSVLSATGSGLGFAAALLLIGLARELLGSGTITLFAVGGFSGTVAVPFLVGDPARALGLAGGGLLCLGYFAGVLRIIRRRRGAAGEGQETGEGRPAAGDGSPGAGEGQGVRT
jgi:electron transport complex protein RnfE